MKITYRLTTIYRSSDEDLMTSKDCDTLDEVYNHIKMDKRANGHSIHKITTVKNDETTIAYYRGYAIFVFNGIDARFIFDMTGNIPIFIGRCRFNPPAYAFIDAHREYGIKNFDLLTY